MPPASSVERSNLSETLPTGISASAYTSVYPNVSSACSLSATPRSAAICGSSDGSANPVSEWCR